MRTILFAFAICLSTGLPVVAQILANKEVWVLLPLAKDAQKVVVEVNEDGEYVYQGDIIIDESQIITDISGRGSRKIDGMLRLKRAQNRQQVHYLSAKNGNVNLWADNTIPFVVDDDFSENLKQLIADAVASINTSTNLQLRPKENGDRHWVVFKPMVRQNSIVAGTSLVGRRLRQGGQYIRLGNDSLMKEGYIIHEILHAAGFVHEQSRSDRDDYITIIWNNIKIRYRDNFRKENESSNETPYDFRSIMHYHKYAFGKIGANGLPMTTIITKPPGQNIGYEYLSAYDIQGINTVYPR